MKAKSIFLAVFAAISLSVNAQSNYASYLDSAWECLKLGKCSAAERNYYVYKDLTGETVLEVEKAIYDCKKGNLIGKSRDSASATYVDLGLRSHTLWKDMDEDDSYLYTWRQAYEKYGSNLPTKKQFDELRASCRWYMTKTGIKAVGPNGNYILFSVTGKKTANGISSNEHGYYWSSDSSWSMSIINNTLIIVGVSDIENCYSVRLVK